MKFLPTRSLEWKKSASKLEEHHHQSPEGKYRNSYRLISEALGCPQGVGTWGGGNPFDLECTRVPAGATNFPYHIHHNQWELFLFVRGQGEVRGPDETVSVGPDDVILFPPGEAHQIINSGIEDLVYYIIADNPSADVIHYPDTDKWAVKPPRKLFRMAEVPYYEPGD